MNRLNTDLNGKCVVQTKGHLKPEYDGLPFMVGGGFGASPATSGRRCAGQYADGERCLIDGMTVEKIIPQAEFDAAVAAVKAGTWVSRAGIAGKVHSIENIDA